MLTQPIGNCFQMQRQLIHAALELSQRLMSLHPDADMLRLGASCMQLAAERALQARDAVAAMRGWHDCGMGERQIRMIVYRGLRDGCIDNETYDEMFDLATRASRIREDERQRLRRKLQHLNLT